MMFNNLIESVFAALNALSLETIQRQCETECIINRGGIDERRAVRDIKSEQSHLLAICSLDALGIPFWVPRYLLHPWAVLCNFTSLKM